VLPVNYVFDDPFIVMRTGEGAMVDHAPMTVVAFEIDGSGEPGTWGWSVVAEGPLLEITDSGDDLAVRLRDLPVLPSAPGQRERWLKLVAGKITGRAFGPIPPARSSLERTPAP
jgi:hypothetical protein